MRLPRQVDLAWPRQYRIVASKFPTINVFENIVSNEQLETAFWIESLTNERLQQTTSGKLARAQKIIRDDGASIVMAAFTHIGLKTRFSDGSYGVYYAARELKTALAESIYHREQFLSATKEQPGELDQRVYVGKLRQSMHDIRNPRNEQYKKLHDPTDYTAAQQFGKILRNNQSWGIVYRSVRDVGGECIAALHPLAVSIPVQGPHFTYVWDGKRISNYYEKRNLKKF